MTTCSQCGASNRTGARFCARCGQALGGAAPGAAGVANGPAGAGVPPVSPGPPSGALTLKVCPRCQARNTLGERTCRQCGYTFTSLGTAMGKRSAGSRLTWVLALAAVLVGVVALMVVLATSLGAFFGGTGIPANPPTQASGAAPLQNAIQATVQIITPDDRDASRSVMGSGSVVDSRGYILTNFHVIGDTATGKLYNQRGLIAIAVAPAGSAQPAEVRYRAELAAGDPELDLALLKIVEDRAGGALPADLGLGVLALGNSDQLQIGDSVTVLGYPGLGGDTLTVTRGNVAGFLPDWMKTDAEINNGNSGGAAIDAAGRLIGVPTASNSEAGDAEHSPGKIGLIRPINAARPLLEKIK